MCGPSRAHRVAVPQVREQLVQVVGVQLAGVETASARQRVPVVLRVQDDPALGRFEDHVGGHDGDSCPVSVVLGVGVRPPDSPGTRAARARRSP